jgi:hypothetical protein
MACVRVPASGTGSAHGYYHDRRGCAATFDDWPGKARVPTRSPSLRSVHTGRLHYASGRLWSPAAGPEVRRGLLLVVGVASAARAGADCGPRAGPAGPGRGPPDGNRGRGSVPVPAKSGTGTGESPPGRFRTNRRGRGRPGGSVPVPGQIGDRPRDGPRLSRSACAEQSHFNNIRQLNELMPSSIRRHHPRKEGPNLKKTQRQHLPVISGAESWSYCWPVPRLGCCSANRDSPNSDLSLDVKLRVSVLRLVRVDRLSCSTASGSLPSRSLSQTDSHLEDVVIPLAWKSASPTQSPT